MLDPAFALGAALVWAISPIYYRGFLEKFDYLSFNLLRTVSATVVLAVPAVYFGIGTGAGLAGLSGVLSLAVGDCLYFLSIRQTSASVAAPVTYTYVLMVQFVGITLGQTIPLANLISAAMVVAGVYILSKTQGQGPRVGDRGRRVLDLRPGTRTDATGSGGNVVALTFIRDAAAAGALTLAFVGINRARKWPRGLTPKDYAFILVFTVSDLVEGSGLFVYSVSIIGVALSVIFTSQSPLLTQIFAKALGKENPSSLDFAGGVLIVGALLLAITL